MRNKIFNHEKNMWKIFYGNLTLSLVINIGKSNFINVYKIL